MLVIAVLLLSVLIAAAEDDLKHWTNDELEVIRTAAHENGKPLIVAARPKPEYTRKSCEVWFPPDDDGWQHKYSVVDGAVYDENGQIVDNIEAWDEGNDHTCGLKILEKTDEHDGTDLRASGFLSQWNSLMYYSTMTACIN